jgi:hypothetical protein
MIDESLFNCNKQRLHLTIATVAEEQEAEVMHNTNIKKQSTNSAYANLQIPTKLR